MRLDGTSTRVPVFGFRPTRGCRCRVRKLPNPRISILSPVRRGVNDAIEDGFDNYLRILASHFNDLRDFFDQVSLGHIMLFLPLLSG